MNRLRNSSQRIALPDFDGQELLKCIYSLLKLEQSWIPDQEGFSLYIRPFVYANNSSLGVRAPDQSILSVVLSPVGPYYASGFKPVSLFCEEKHIRCAPGGVGGFKVGSNYGPTLKISQ